MNVCARRDSDIDAKDILIEDYRYLSEALWRNEQSDETRVNWFILIVSAAVAGLISLIMADQRVDAELVRPVIAAALLGLLVFGLLTFVRMVTRNEDADRYKHGLDTVRQALKDHCVSDPAINGYNPIAPRTSRRSEKKVDRRSFKLRKFGGLAHTVAGVNSVLVGALAITLTYGLDGKSTGDLWIYALAAIAFLTSLAVHAFYAARREVKVRSALQATEPTHAGGIVYRSIAGGVEYLLVTPRSKRDEWVFPKGYIERGEGHGEAAWREVLEETGVFGRLVCPIGRMRFTKNGTQVVTKLYLVETIHQSTPSEKRRLAWRTLDDAIAQLSHLESKQMLAAAERLRIDFSGGD